MNKILEASGNPGVIFALFVTVVVSFAAAEATVFKRLSVNNGVTTISGQKVTVRPV